MKSSWGDIQMKNWYRLFEGCSRLVSIPGRMPASVERLHYVFAFCEGITEIPEDLLWECENLQVAGGLFSYCYSLISIPENLFDNNPKANNFRHVFAYYSAQTGTTHSPFGCHSLTIAVT